MITTPDNGRQTTSGNEFATHMAALERLRRELESGDLDPVEALHRCRQAEQHYRAVDAILTGVEQELDEMEGLDA
jgi:exonuclease VII small subunit